ncbi:hypothetical protein FACS1894139_12480 [Planctomycetales bacterium]|nr:hypothetical protein FACS1894108_01900 [Planctomycetales bacterium]GHT06498.1 hypothetical protein FACS1894139_12480 [Planctomycetales bacterium]GHV20364.1 hypothetical protein AGMMS49959_07530 [Planctomycetales bacterium]
MTAALARIEVKLNELSPESTRYHVLAAVRAFRSNWVELGRLLNEVALGGDYKDWGYADFDMYCARELGLKKPTVQKLVVSYNYMKKRAPERLERTADATFDVPDYQTVELLHKAEANPHLTADDRAEFHRRAFAPWEDGEPLDETALRKEIRSRAADPQSVEDANARRGQTLAPIKTLSRRLRELLANARAVPHGLKQRLEEALCELEELD